MQQFNFKSTPYSGFFWLGELLEEFNSPFQNIQIIYHPEMGNTLVLDHYIMITQKDEHQYHELITHPNCLQLPQWKNALVIGGGDGLCMEELLKYPFERIELVEIDQEVSRMSQKYFSKELGDTFDNPRVHTHYQNALDFFPSHHLYDFIALDLNDPTEEFMHSHPLYSQNFYASCKNSLTPSGIMTVQIGCPYLFRSHFTHNVKTLKSLFKYVAIYGQYMRCYGTYQFFAACSDSINLMNPHFDTIQNNIKKSGLNYLQLYNPDMHKGLFMYNNEIKAILKDC